CSFLYFGDECQSTCNENCIKGCVRETGWCIDGCKPGYRGETCSKECSDGRFGKNCSSLCPVNCNDGCHHVTGNCLKGKCKAGYTDRQCTSAKTARTGTVITSPETATMDAMMVTRAHIVMIDANQEDMDSNVLDSAAPTAKTAVISLQGYVKMVVKKDSKEINAMNAQTEDMGPECDYGLYGMGCRTFCGECKRPPCDKVRGTCRGGCMSGYVGDNCHSPCQAGRFGPGCSQWCKGHCKNGEPCNHVTGECRDGCADGWQGSDCSTACPPGSYGFNCSKRCSGNCKGGASCDHVTGHCTQGCAENWTGEMCDHCIAGKFGDGCSEVCSGNCRNNEPCNEKTGHCEHGCQPGWMPHFCNERTCHHVTGKCNDGCESGYKNDDCKTLCDDGTYGEECQMTCGRCKDGTPCNKATGHCHDGCVGNVFGDKCDVCIAGKYGEYCELDCSPNCRDAEKLCDRVSGRCYRGCKSGFIGDKCEIKRTLGLYGENCSSTCGRCSPGAPCDASTGICLLKSSCLDSENCALQQRCEENWEGERCDVKIKSSAGHWAWLLLLPLLIVILVLIWRRRARTKPSEELSLNVLPANGVSPKVESQSNIQRQVRPRAQLPAIEASPQPDVIPPPVQLNVSPPLPTRPRSVAPPVTEVQSRLIPLFELEQYIEESVASGQLATQHAIFPRGLTAPSLEAARQENLGKNRWRNVVPYDDSRVVLDPLPHKPHSNYINASYIDGYMKEKAFIATQGPKAGTVDDLWRLVWQENVTCIVMLCNLTEGGKTKCEQYWPEIGYCAHHSNEILVRTNSENAFLDHTERIFTVSRGNNDASRTVMQLHYTSWPDHGVPRYAHSLACVLRQVPLDNDAPILVHC
ncbi:hypothetical protein B566_EDAN015822, partial [Ephemera danica]